MWIFTMFCEFSSPISFFTPVITFIFQFHPSILYWLGFGLDNYFVLVLKKYFDIELILSFVKAILILLYDKKKIRDQNWRWGKNVGFFTRFIQGFFFKNFPFIFLWIYFLVLLVWQLYMLVQYFILFTFQCMSLREKRDVNGRISNENLAKNQHVNGIYYGRFLVEIVSENRKVCPFLFSDINKEV